MQKYSDPVDFGKTYNLLILMEESGGRGADAHHPWAVRVEMASALVADPQITGERLKARQFILWKA
jgi:hypothetical protein